ncbi:MAG: cytochrome c-type biogenesis protein [Xanthomonadaceae bacterium]|nr:cytochrome c-type biogenesis protein [Xanthomonadaceae bacterium]
MRSLALALLLFAGAVAAVDPMPFRDAAEEARFRALTAELRCVMCQNQSLADSSAPIARDLRREVFDLMREGRSDEEIKAFLVERYTDFVLYKPPLNDRTWWLWFAPVLILVAGAATVATIVRRRAKANSASKPEPEDAW